MIQGYSSMATRAILAELTSAYEQNGGGSVSIQSMGGVDAARLVREGAEVDIVILASDAMAALEADGHIVAGSITPFALSGMAVAVRSGTPLPDIGTDASLAAAVKAAGKTGYSTGPSGKHLLKLCERWGLMPELDGRLIEAPAGVPVGSLLAKGEIDIAFQQRSELINVPGIDVVGLLPAEAQSMTVFSAGISATTGQGAAVRKLIDFLVSPEASAAKIKHGMDAPSV